MYKCLIPDNCNEGNYIQNLSRCIWSNVLYCFIVIVTYIYVVEIMNQVYIQVINFACIIYLIYLTLSIGRDNAIENVQSKKEESFILVDKIKEVLRDELKYIQESHRQSHPENDRLDEKSEQVRNEERGNSSNISEEVVMWIEDLKGQGMKYFSQNDEDGAIEAIFDKIGTKDKIYVEFGVEDCSECNTRYLRSDRKYPWVANLIVFNISLFQRGEKLEYGKVTFAGWRT